MQLADLLLDVSQAVEIEAAPGTVFETMLTRFGPENSTPGGEPMPMVLERWPGGRWFRDLGNEQGHLWGFVQVIKPPTLLEISGPMFMSYPAAGHIQLRVAQIPNGAKLSLRHQVLGLIDDEHRKGVVPGWQHALNTIKQQSEQR